MTAKDQAASSRQSLVTDLNAYALEVFKENNRIAALIEDKAQKTIAVAGIVLSAGLAFLRGGLRSTLTSTELHFLILGLFMLAGSMLGSLWVLKVSANPNMPGLQERSDYTLDLLDLPWYALTIEIMTNSKSDLLTVWLDSVSSQEKVNQSKAHVLNSAQALLVLSLLAISAVLFIALS